MTIPHLTHYDGSNVYIFMIHKLYVERLHTYVSHCQQDASSVTWNILDVPKQSGVSQARRGYVILWLSLGEGSSRFLPPLSPMIRQNIAWVAPISHLACAIDDDVVPIGDVIWISTLRDRLWDRTAKALIDNSSISLRVDCYPKSPLTEKLCRQLQHAVREMIGDRFECADPFEGPLPMTMSKSKCTHRLTVVRIQSENFSSYDYYWGLECRSDSNRDNILMDLALNHEAAEEMAVVPQETAPTIGDPAIPRPVSRAYYKLLELYQDYLCQTPEADILQELLRTQSAVAMDWGAAPGGWTQVLLQHMGVSTVVAVDKAKLAPLHRLLKNSAKQRLVHVPATLENFSFQTFLDNQEVADEKRPSTSFSILVCDASVQWNNLLPLILQTMQRNQTAVTWTLPAMLVLTLKLPFKTIPSLQRHVADIQQQVPIFIQNLQSILYPPSVSHPPMSSRHRIIHLMANSDSERTLLIFFEAGGGTVPT
jgi:predicted rRNA methylase YqxC with S4 and FtsJ domains